LDKPDSLRKDGELAPRFFAFLIGEPNAELAKFTLAAPRR
jgi:hypothetical protein